ncbi:MAG: FIST C-terminal domain-containing protein [Alphaproteobacteria bacterium]|nr:FIST C-terminal domain-containing protein [Alphaproteobacteria bacterium]
MQAATFHYDLESRKWSLPRPPALDSSRTLVLAFGPSSVLAQPEPMQALARAYPSAQVLGCSTSGEIVGQEVRDGVLSAAVLKFEKTDLGSATVEVTSAADSYAAGRKLARELDAPDLRAVFVLSEGLKVNGSELVRGLNEVLGTEVVVTGGLAGDGSRFERTWVAHGTTVKSGLVAAVGFYGDHVVVGHGSKGGWDKFGPERTVTRSESNVVYEIDGRPALALYKEYLGPKASELPASGLLFPLAVRSNAADDQILVRTLLAVDEARQSLTFAGDVPTGHLVQLMKADFDRLVGGATEAAGAARGLVPEVDSPTVAIAISCVGRRLVLGDRTEDEVEAVAHVLPDGALVAGFYSYGELSPFATGACRLHNQTMTLTTFAESPEALGRRARAPVQLQEQPVVVPIDLTPPQAAAPTDGDGTATVLRPQASAAVARSSGPRVSVARLSGEQGRGATGLDVQQRTIGSVTLVTLAGRVNEGFQGGATGRALKGEVVLDLSRVERVTSFGVREWLAMLKESEGRADPIWLAHCSEPVVNQITMIRGFAGRAKVLSFFAPYTCPSCGAAYASLVDAIGDREAVETLTPPETTCPRCTAVGAFDDDPQSYFSLRSHLAAQIPDSVARVLAVLDPAGTAEAIEKTIDGRLTLVRLHTPLDGSIRWSRVLDGVEGEVAFDLSGAATSNAEGAVAFEAGLRAIAGDVDAIRIDGAPRPVVERLLGARGLPAFELSSVVVDAHCDHCAQPRAVRVDLVADGDRIRAGGDPEVACKRCNQPLSFDATRTLLRMAVQGRTSAAPTPKPAAAVSAPATLAPAAAPPIAAAPPVVVSQGGPGWMGVAAFSVLAATTAVLAAVVCMGAFGVFERGGSEVSAPPPAPAPVAEAAPTWTGGDVLPPAWTEVPVAVSAAQVLVVGHGGPAASDEEALAQAREAAVLSLVGQIRSDLASPARDAVDARIRTEPTGDAAARVVERYLRDQGARATPERSEATLRVKDGGHEAFAQYRLDREVYDAVVADYGATVDLAGATVARTHPSLAATLTSEADLWVVAVDRAPASRSGVLAGDLLLSVDGSPVHALDDLAPDGRSLWDRTAQGSSLVLVLEANGASREVKLSKPRPPPPPPPAPTPAPPTRPAPGR